MKPAELCPACCGGQIIIGTAGAVGCTAGCSELEIAAASSEPAEETAPPPPDWTILILAIIAVVVALWIATRGVS